MTNGKMQKRQSKVGGNIQIENIGAN